MIKHGSDVAKNVTKYLNGDQVAIMCLDQQLYTIAKKIQWLWPNEYGEKQIVYVMGPLHIEQAWSKVLGQALEDSGLTTIITQAGLATTGSAEALLKVK